MHCIERDAGGMNRVQLIGVLVWPIEVWHDRATSQVFGKAMFAVSVGEAGLAFIPVILQNSEAVDASMYLGEGSQVEVTGHLHSSLITSYDANGIKRTRRVLHVIADRVRYLVVRQAHGGDRA